MCHGSAAQRRANIAIMPRTYQKHNRWDASFDVCDVNPARGSEDDEEGGREHRPGNQHEKSQAQRKHLAVSALDNAHDHENTREKEAQDGHDKDWHRDIPSLVACGGGRTGKKEKERKERKERERETSDHRVSTWSHTTRSATANTRTKLAMTQRSTQVAEKPHHAPNLRRSHQHGAEQVEAPTTTQG